MYCTSKYKVLLEVFIVSDFSSTARKAQQPLPVTQRWEQKKLLLIPHSSLSRARWKNRWRTEYGADGGQVLCLFGVHCCCRYYCVVGNVVPFVVVAFSNTKNVSGLRPNKLRYVLVIHPGDCFTSSRLLPGVPSSDVRLISISRGVRCTQRTFDSICGRKSPLSI